MKTHALFLCLFFSLRVFAITSSVPATGDLWQSVVFIKVPLAASQNSEEGDVGYCNGTLISPDRLVTAAHCFLNAKISKENPLVIELGQYRFIEKNGQKINVGYVVTASFNVTGTFSSPAGRIDSGITNDPNNDFAIFQIETPLPLPGHFYFLPVWKGELPQKNLIQDFYVVSVNYMATVSSSNARQLGTLGDVSVFPYRLEARSGSNVEPGDSGAPLTMMFQNQVYLIGVTKGHAETWFANWDVFTLFSNRFE